MECAPSRARSSEPSGTAVERGAPVDELGDVARALGGKDLHSRGVAQAVARPDGVRHVQRDGVVGPHGGRDAPLRVAGTARARICLGEDEDTAVGCERKSRPQARDAAADDEEIGGDAGDHWAVILTGCQKGQRAQGKRAEGWNQ